MNRRGPSSRSRSTIIQWVGAIGLGFLMGACEPYPYSDLDWHEIPLWCGEWLCGWRVEEGEAVRTTTWHKEASAIGLVGDPVVITMDLSLSELDSAYGYGYGRYWNATPECLQFTTIADAEPRVSVYLEVVTPRTTPGHPEASYPLRTQNYARTVMAFPLNPAYAGITVVVRKEGRGRAEFVYLAASGSYDCPAAPEWPTDEDAGPADGGN